MVGTTVGASSFIGSPYTVPDVGADDSGRPRGPEENGEADVWAKGLPDAGEPDTGGLENGPGAGEVGCARPAETGRPGGPETGGADAGAADTGRAVGGPETGGADAGAADTGRAVGGPETGRAVPAGPWPVREILSVGPSELTG
ncbi:MAG TPA: hypothetical protein H9881_07835 [Candidatus Stackebrandtia excrementipullorum]|nr:hypothetical protein [Candidatus Stackebrandtia excrementipullorum]